MLYLAIYLLRFRYLLCLLLIIVVANHSPKIKCVKMLVGAPESFFFGTTSKNVFFSNLKKNGFFLVILRRIYRHLGRKVPGKSVDAFFLSSPDFIVTGEEIKKIENSSCSNFDTTVQNCCFLLHFSSLRARYDNQRAQKVSRKLAVLNW